MKSYLMSVNIILIPQHYLFLPVNLGEWPGEIFLGPCKVAFRVRGRGEGYISAVECNTIPRCSTCWGTYVHLTDVFLCTNPGRLHFCTIGCFFPASPTSLTQRSARLCTIVALYAVCWWGLTVDNGSWTYNRNDRKSKRNEYSVWSTRISQVGKTAPYLWVLSAGHASQSGALNFVVALKFLENACNPGYANIIDVAVAVSCPVDIVHTIHLLRPLRCIAFMMSKNVTRFNL